MAIVNLELAWALAELKLESAGRSTWSTTTAAAASSRLEHERRAASEKRLEQHVRIDVLILEENIRIQCVCHSEFDLKLYTKH